MMLLSEYLRDGADNQARAVLAMLQDWAIEESWSNAERRYQAEIRVGRWENCREQGYVLMLKDIDCSRQLNIAFFQHRNGDQICAIKWEEVTVNTPTVETAKFGGVYESKWDLSHTSGYGEIMDMVGWIQQELTAFWEQTKH